MINNKIYIYNNIFFFQVKQIKWPKKLLTDGLVCITMVIYSSVLLPVN